MRDAESEADILGRETTKTWVNNIVKEYNVTAHDGIHNRILSMLDSAYTPIDNRHLYHGTLNWPHMILRRSNIAQDELLS